MTDLLHRTTRRQEEATRPLGQDRGASLVEYALLLGLFVVVSIGAIEALQGSASDRFVESSGDAGTPTEINGYYGDRTSAPTGGGGGDTPDDGGLTVASVSLGGGTSTPSGTGNKWNASITANVVDVDGAPVVGATVRLGWSGATTGDTELTTDGSGSAVWSVNDLNHNKDLTFEVLEVSADGYTFEGPYPSVTLSK